MPNALFLEVLWEVLLSLSGKEKAHKHKRSCPVIAWVRGVSRPGGQESNVYVLCAEPKEHKHFRPGTRPGGSVTGVTEKLFMRQMFMCPFRSLFWGAQGIGVLKEVLLRALKRLEGYREWSREYGSC